MPLITNILKDYFSLLKSAYECRGQQATVEVFKDCNKIPNVRCKF